MYDVTEGCEYINKKTTKILALIDMSLKPNRHEIFLFYDWIEVLKPLIM